MRTATEPMLPSRFSQCRRLWEILRDEQWHTTSELLREVPCIVHSRIAELRKAWGWDIKHETIGPGAKGSRYRIVNMADWDGVEPTRRTVPPRDGAPLPSRAPSNAGAVTSLTAPASPIALWWERNEGSLRA